MAKKISEKDIFQGDIFANARKSATEYIKMLEALQGELKEMLAINKKIVEQSASQIKTTDALKKRAKAIKEVTEASKSMEVVEREKVKTQRELTKLEADNERLLQTKNRTLIQQRKEEERLAKIKAKNLKIAKQEGQAYSQMSKKLNELRNRYKNLAVQNKENTKEGRNLLKTIQQMDTRLKQIDKSVGQSQRNVGNYTSAWGKLGMRLKSVASAFGLVGGVMGFANLVKSSVNVVVDFDTAIANLGAVSGASDEDLAKLTEMSKKLGESTKFTASEVAGLSLELAKLGFTTDEIMASTESVLALASATGTELADASFIAGSTLRAFNLEASEMDRVASTLGVATTKSALNMEFLGTAMSKVAPVSSSLGFSLEDTTALLGTLANAGFDASSSATATKNILLKLVDTNGALAQSLGKPITNLDELVPALNELKDGGINLADALELTDKRSVSAFNTFLNQTETMVGLRDSITDVNDELANMSEKQLDTISGQLALLNSKWQGMILGASDSAGAVEGLKNAIKFITNNLETIIKVIGKVIRFWAIYKARIIAIRIAQSGFIKQVRTMGLTMMKGRFSVKALGTAFKSLGRAMKGVGFTIAIDLVLQLAQGLYETANGTRALRIEEEKRAKAKEKEAEAQEEAGSRIEEANKRLSKALKELDQEEEKRMASGEKKSKLNEEFAKRREEAIQSEIDLFKESIKEQKNQVTLATKMKQVFLSAENSWTNMTQEMQKGKTAQQITNSVESSAKLLNKWKELSGQSFILGETNRTFNRDFQSGSKANIKLSGEIVGNYDKQVEKLRLMEEELVKFTEQSKDQKHQNDVNALADKKYKMEQFKRNKTLLSQLQSINKLESEYNKIIEERRKLMNEIESLNMDELIRRTENQAERELELQLKNAEAGNEVSLTKFQEFLDNKYALLETAQENETEFRISEIEIEQAEYEKKLNAELQANKKQLDQLVKDGKLSRKKADEIILKQEKKTQSIIIESRKKTSEEIEIEYIKEKNAFTKLQEDKVKENADAQEQILDEVESTTDSVSQKEREQLKERLDAFRDFTNQIIQLMDKRTDAQIKAIDKELSVSEKREDELRRLAEKGTTTAEQSLASEQKRQAELERQKEELEKKKLRRQAILSGLDLLSSKIDNNETDAVSSTIRDITSLIAIIGNLPAFAEGSEYVERGNAPKGTDKILARVDEGERILTKDQNKRIGNISNEQLTSMAQHWDDVNWVQPKVQKLHEPFQSSSMILSKFDELQKTIENKPMLTEVRWDEVSQMIVEKVETKQRIENRHKSSKGIF